MGSMAIMGCRCTVCVRARPQSGDRARTVLQQKTQLYICVRGAWISIPAARRPLMGSCAHQLEYPNVHAATLSRARRPYRFPVAPCHEVGRHRTARGRGHGLAARCAQTSHPQDHPEQQHHRARPDLDHRVRHAQLRLHGLRHAVRDRPRRPTSSRRWSTSGRSSADNKTWTFTLRDGLEFHDGKPVTGEDVVASIKRWASRDTFGAQAGQERRALRDARRQDLRDRAEGTLRPGARGAGQAVVERAVHRCPSASPRPIGRHADQGVRSAPARTSSRPTSCSPGETRGVHQNTRYKPRAEAASGMAGGKNV